MILAGKVDSDSVASRVIMLLAGAALVGLGVSMWRNPRRPEDTWRRMWWPETAVPDSPERTRLAAAFTVGVGLVLMASMAVILLTQSN
jgi:hypothetical protein